MAPYWWVGPEGGTVHPKVLHATEALMLVLLACMGPRASASCVSLLLSCAVITFFGIHVLPEAGAPL